MVSGKKANTTGKVLIFGRMAISMWGSGPMEAVQVMEYRPMQKVRTHTKAHGKIICSMAKGSFFGLMEIVTKASMLKIKSTVPATLNMLTVLVTMASSGTVQRQVRSSHFCEQKVFPIGMHHLITSKKYLN